MMLSRQSNIGVLRSVTQRFLIKQSSITRSPSRAYAQSVSNANSKPPVAIYGIDGTYASALVSSSASPLILNHCICWVVVLSRVVFIDASWAWANLLLCSIQRLLRPHPLRLLPRPLPRYSKSSRRIPNFQLSSRHPPFHQKINRRSFRNYSAKLATSTPEIL